MVLQEDRERVQALLKDTITLLCRNGLSFRSEFSIEALIGITLDKNDVFLVSINENIKSDMEPVVEIQSIPQITTNNTPIASRHLGEASCHRRKRSRVKPNGSHSEHEEDSVENVWSQSDSSSLAMSGMDDSNSRLSQDSDAEPIPKQRTLLDVRNKDSGNHVKGIMIKEEIWEEDVVSDADDGNDGGSDNFAVTDMKPKVQAVSQDLSVEAGTGVLTPAQQLLSLQEQYRAARPAREATITSNDTAQSNHSSSSIEKSQIAGHPADLTGHPADLTGHPADLSCHSTFLSSGHTAKLSSGHSTKLSSGHSVDVTGGEPADLSSNHPVQHDDHPANLTSGHPADISAHLADLTGHPADLLAGGYPADLLTSICKQMLPRFPVQPPIQTTVFSDTSAMTSTPVKCDHSSHPYKCEVCGKRYMKRDGLVRHWKYHDSTLHPCRRCTLFFQSEEQLQSHIDTKHGPDNLKHACPVCGKKFDRPQLLKKHVETRHYQSYTIPETSDQ